MRKTSGFTKFAKKTAHFTGRPVAFAIAGGSIIAWGLMGPLFGFGEAWQLVINTLTTIVTFLMVFLIQNTQNRDTAAMHIKLDELIRATRGAHNELLDLEELDEEELRRILRRYERLAAGARQRLRG